MKECKHVKKEEFLWVSGHWEKLGCLNVFCNLRPANSGSPCISPEECARFELR